MKLEAFNLSKVFSGKTVVKDISLSVKRGEVVGLLGPNGAGKTTTFYMIMGLINPTGGSIYLNNNNITKLPVYKRSLLGISYLPQESSVFRNMSVEDNIMSVLELRRDLSLKERKNILDKLLDDFSITNIRKSIAISLSGGERRRVEIARNLASDPSFVLFDEPLAGIDPLAIKNIKKLILHLKNQNIGVLITEHNVRDTFKLVDKAVVIYEGRVFIEGKPDEITSNEQVRKIYLGDDF